MGALDEDNIFRKAGGFIAPKSGLPLLETDDTTLDDMYYEDDAGTTWRSSLIPGDEDQPHLQWTNLTREGPDSSFADHDFSRNVSPLRIHIAVSAGETEVTVTKNDHSATVTFTSTWEGGEKAHLYMATDYYNDDEEFR